MVEPYTFVIVSRLFFVIWCDYFFQKIMKQTGVIVKRLIFHVTF